MNINVPLSEVNIFLREDEKILVSFIRRVQSPYLFYPTFHWLTAKQYIALIIRLREKYGYNTIRRLMSGTLLLTWECEVD